MGYSFVLMIVLLRTISLKHELATNILRQSHLAKMLLRTFRLNLLLKGVLYHCFHDHRFASQLTQQINACSDTTCNKTIKRKKTFFFSKSGHF